MSKFTIFFLVAFVAEAYCNSPGLQARISERGLNYGSKVIMNYLPQMVVGRTLPAMNGKANVIVGDVHYNINRVKVNRLNLGSISKQVTSNGVQINVNNLGAGVTGHWSYRYQIAFISVGDSGTFTASVGGTNLNVVGRLGETGGRASASVSSCSAQVRDLHINLQGGASWLYNMFLGIVVPMVKGEISKAICDGVSDVVRQEVNPALARIKLEIPLGELGIFDFHLTKTPKYVPSYVETYHRGRFIVNGDSSQPPFHPAPFPEAGPHNKMLSVWVSDFVPNSLLFLLQKHGLLEITLSKDNAAPDVADFFEVTCDSTCFGTVLPPDVKAKYEGGSAVIKASALEQPELTIKPGQAEAIIRGKIVISVRNPETYEEQYIFTAEVTATVEAKASLLATKIHFEVDSISASLTVTDTKYDSIKSSSLNLLLKLGLRSTVIPMLNDIGKQGLPMPEMRGVTIISPQLSFYQNAIVMKTDGSFQI